MRLVDACLCMQMKIEERLRAQLNATPRNDPKFNQIAIELAEQLDAAVWLFSVSHCLFSLLSCKKPDTEAQGFALKPCP